MIYTIPIKDVAADSPERKRLKKELAAEALDRLEESARTAEEFKSVTKWWDRRDENRERRERYYEQRVSNDMFDWNFEDWVAFEEDFLNIIFMCICEMHYLTSDPDISRVVNNSTYKQKSIFFQRYILNRSTERVANDNDITDRNVRKHTDKMLEKAQAGIYESFLRLRKEQQPLYKRQRLFLDAYSSKDEKTKIVSIISYVPKEKPKKKTRKKTKAINSSGNSTKLSDKTSANKKSAVDKSIDR